jgi:hypothetical protein
MKNVRLFPSLHMIYAYTPIEPGRTRIQPIYVAERKKGLFGWFMTRLLLFFTRLGYYALRGEEEKYMTIFGLIRMRCWVLICL